MTTTSKQIGQSYRVWSLCDDGKWCLEGTRAAMKSAFALARSRFREYKHAKQIKVTLLDGSLIADDPSDFTMKTGASR